MTPERWQEMKKVLAGALEQKPEGRRVYLDQACADPDFRREVESLIAAHEQGDSSFMERPVVVSPSSEALKSGSRLGNYEILARIGAGGMGVVYSARDTVLGRTVAIKVLPNAFLNDPERLARFQREARVLASLNHPNISTVHGVEQSGSTRALVMEMVEGPTLADRIRQGPIPIEEALRIAKQICEALEYAHEHGVVHRDLKPANVKVTSDDAVKVLDFGLAKALAGDAGSIDIANSPTISQMATEAGVLLGTAAYMSPQQAKGKAVDRRADIWAFGSVFYEMLTGKMAFRGESATDTLAAVIRAEPDWSQLPAATPPPVRVLLRRCLQKDPKQRLQAIGDARIALDEVLSGASEPPSTSGISAPLWRRSIPWALFGLTAAAFAALLWLHEAQLRTAVPAAEVRLQIPFPAKPQLRLTGLMALSPNGQQLAFTATSGDGVSRVWLRDLSSLEMRPLSGTEYTENMLFWSPDSRFVAFDSGGKLLKIDVSGGPPQMVCALNKAGVGGSWNQDGVIIFGQFGGSLMRVSAEGGEAKPLTVLDPSHGEFAHTAPSFLPDGKRFLYLRESGTSGAVSVGSLSAKPEEQDSRVVVQTDFGAVYVPSSDPNSGRLLFLRRGTLMAQTFDARHMNLSGDPVRVVEGGIGGFTDSGLFSISTNGTLAYVQERNNDTQLTWFDAQGKTLSTVGEPGGYGGISISPDGTRVCYSKATLPDYHGALWLLDISRGTSTRFGDDPSANDEEPVWAPDGRSIIFVSGRAGHVGEIYERPLSGAQDVLVLASSSEVRAPQSWSPDGRFVIYTAISGETKADLWVLPLGDHRKPAPFLRTEFDEFDGHFSPDGHWVAYVSGESGRNEVYVRPFLPDASGEAISDAENKLLISKDGGSSPFWRQDGKVLYFMANDGKLITVDVALRPVFQVGVPKALFQTPPGVSNGRWAPSPDGKRFLFLVQQPQAEMPFTIVLNWQAGLKK